MNLIWDDSAPIRSHYLDFLSAICKNGENGMSLNQENVYKLYKTYNNIREVLNVDIFENNMDEQQLKELQEKELNLGELQGSVIRYDKKKQQTLSKEIKTEEQMLYTANLIKFYSSVSYGRNFLWKEELKGYFNPDSLFS